jgi:hypothetical protein
MTTNSTLPVLCLFMCIGFAGCTALDSKKAEEPEPSPITASMWRRSESHRPAHTDIRRARIGLPESLQAVRQGLRNHDPFVRRKAAYLLEALGTVARACAQDLRTALAIDQDVITRAILVRAICSIGDNSEESINLIRKQFRKEEDQILLTYLAGALVRLDLGDDSKVAEEWLIRSLILTRDVDSKIPKRPPEFWEKCWAAIFMIGKLGDEARPFISTVEAFGDDDTLPVYLQREVVFTYGRLRQAGVID